MALRLLLSYPSSCSSTPGGTFAWRGFESTVFSPLEIRLQLYSYFIDQERMAPSQVLLLRLPVYGHDSLTCRPLARARHLMVRGAGCFGLDRGWLDHVPFVPFSAQSPPSIMCFRRNTKLYLTQSLCPAQDTEKFITSQCAPDRPN